MDDQNQNQTQNPDPNQQPAGMPTMPDPNIGNPSTDNSGMGNDNGTTPAAPAEETPVAPTTDMPAEETHEPVAPTSDSGDGTTPPTTGGM